MADAVESMFSASNMVPWHGLGTIVKDALTADEALTQSGQDWLVEKVPMEMTWDGKQVFIPGRFITVRNRDGRALGVVKSEYTPLQNHEAFSFFDEIVSRKEAIYETAGVLNDGARVWILARLPGEIYVKTRRGAEDITNKYVVIANSHDGSTGVQAKVTPIRVVCNNTLTAAMRGGSFNVRHTKNVADRVQQAAKVMGFTNKMYEQLQVAYQSMADKDTSKRA
jgi:phage/plasmid-like protein (TIGR03299 family)